MDSNTMKMSSRVPYRIKPVDDEKVILWIDSAHNDVVEATMPGVIAAEETERSLDMFVHTREYFITLDPLATTPDHAMHALADYLNAEIGIEPSPSTPPVSAVVQEG